MATLRLLLEDDDGSSGAEMKIPLSEKQLHSIHKALSVTFSIEGCFQFGASGEFNSSFRYTTQFSSNILKIKNQNFFPPSLKP